MKAMILAAGFGTRLQPYSLLRPKPLFPVLNTPLLLHTLWRLQSAGFTEIGINCHHLAPQIMDSVQDMSGVHLFIEETVLGTGGGLKNAEEWCGEDTVLVTNGDIYHDLDFAQIMRHHKEQGNLVTLVCHDFPRFNKVSLGRGQRVLQFTPCEGATTLVAFTGVHVLDARILSTIEPGFSSIIDCYQSCIDRSGQVRAMVAQDHFWLDMGTPADYLELHRILLLKDDSAFLIHPTVELDDVILKDWVVVGEHAILGKGSQLERVVVWDGARVAPGSCLKDEIIT